MITTLYKQDVSGTIRSWSIEKIGVDIIAMTYGTIDGSLQTRTEKIELNQSGRSLEEQVLLRMASRISKRRDQGYVNSYDQAVKEKPTNTLNLKRPMLAQPLKKIILPESFLMQYKYDGNRCLITKQNGKIIAYTRNGKIFKSIDHIIDAAKGIPEGMTLDGELYKHGVPLQTLRSWISKDQSASEGLEYICYDHMGPEDIEERIEQLVWLELQDPIFIAQTRLMTSKNNITDELNIARKELGYEGLILRIPGSKYEDGKRSKSLIKVKAWEDAEFLVVDIIPSKDNWAILECATATGKHFRVSAPGTIPEKEEVLQNRINYIGRKITVEYANLTKDSIPFHPVAIAWR